MNLDHVGTNNPLIRGDEFLEHFEALKVYARESGGYVTISSLPEEFSEEIKNRFISGIYELYDKEGYQRT